MTQYSERCIVALVGGNSLPQVKRLSKYYMKQFFSFLKIAVAGLLLSGLSSCEGIRMKFAMLEAAENGDYQTVQSMLDKGIPIESRRGRDWRTALHLAAVEGHYGICKMLIERGADVNVEDKSVCWYSTKTGQVKSYWYDTPLHLAAVGNHADVCQLLINNGAIVNRKNSEGWTPLRTAIEHGSESAARVLIQNGGSY